MNRFVKHPPDDVPASAEFFDSAGLLGNMDDLVICAVMICCGCLLFAGWEPQLQEVLKCALSALLLVYHKHLSTSLWVRFLIGATLGLGLSVAGIFFFMYKFTMSMVPEGARSTIKWSALIASLFGMGTMQIFSKGLLRYIQMVKVKTWHFIGLLWSYEWEPKPGSVFALNGLITYIPVGKAFFAAFMLFGIFLVWHFGWFEARLCQECGDRLVDVECEDCAHQGQLPRLCQRCHKEVDPNDCHVNARQVCRISQRFLSLTLWFLGAYLMVAPTFDYGKMLALAAIVIGTKGQVVRFLQHHFWLFWGSSWSTSPAYYGLNKSEASELTQWTTERELRNLRQQFLADRSLMEKLDPATRNEVQRFMYDEKYTPVCNVDQEAHDRRGKRQLFVITVLVTLLAIGYTTDVGHQYRTVLHGKLQPQVDQRLHPWPKAHQIASRILILLLNPYDNDVSIGEMSTVVEILTDDHGMGGTVLGGTWPDMPPNEEIGNGDATDDDPLFSSVDL